MALVVCEVVRQLEGRGLMFDDSAAEAAEEPLDKLFNPYLLWRHSICQLIRGKRNLYTHTHKYIH